MTAPALPVPPPANPGVGAFAWARGSRSRTRTRRNVELVLLLFGMALVAVYASAVELGLYGRLKLDFVLPLAGLTTLFIGAHIAIRWLAPYADPVLLPAVALINSIGVMFLRRLDMGAAKVHDDDWNPVGTSQLAWTALAVLGALALLYFVRDHRALSRYAYTLGLVGIVLVLAPAVLPAKFSEINGAKLWIRIAGFQIQPGEFAKLTLLVFFAYYLVRKREVLSLASKRVLGIDFPRGRDLGPVVTVWLMSLMVLVVEKDLGTSLLYFGMFVVTLYIATERVSWLIIGLMLFIGGAFVAYTLGGLIGGPFANFHERAQIWVDPFSDRIAHGRPVWDGDGFQLVQSLLAFGAGGLFGAGPGLGLFRGSLPEVQTDFIFAGMGEEIGLFGLTALLVVYLVIVERGMRAAIGVRDSFGKLYAGGLSFTLGLQVFVIVGGVTKLIPLTGQTTPFLSAGGSSLVANWLLIALLLRISDAARRPATGSASARGGRGPAPAPANLQELPTEVVR